jgi:hypothetical protein
MALLASVAALALLGALGADAGAKKKKGGFPTGPYPSLGTCPVFPANALLGAPAVGDESSWNQDISASPLDPNSGNYISYINSHGGADVHPDFGSPREYGIPYAVVGKKQKKTRVKFTAFGSESTHGAYRVPLGAPVEGGATADGDRHVLTVDTKRCLLYELYNAHPVKRGKPHWNADAGVIWNLRSPDLRTEGFTSADAAGLPIFPGLARFDEAASGQINHALRVTFSRTKAGLVHPGNHCAGATDDAFAPPMGLRLRLGAGYDISGFSGPALAIAQALKRYGLIVADNGSNWYISGTSDRRWPDENLNQLKAIPGAAFEVVQSAEPTHACGA